MINNMEKIDAKTLAFVLETTVKEANKMIIRCLERDKGNDKTDLNGYALDYSKNESAQIDVIERVFNIPIKAAIDNIKKNYVRSPITRTHILEYPGKKNSP